FHPCLHKNDPHPAHPVQPTRDQRRQRRGRTKRAQSASAPIQGYPRESLREQHAPLGYWLAPLRRSKHVPAGGQCCLVRGRRRDQILLCLVCNLATLTSAL